MIMRIFRKCFRSISKITISSAKEPHEQKCVVSKSLLVNTLCIWNEDDQGRLRFQGLS